MPLELEFDAINSLMKRKLPFSAHWFAKNAKSAKSMLFEPSKSAQVSVSSHNATLSHWCVSIAKSFISTRQFSSKSVEGHQPANVVAVNMQSKAGIKKRYLLWLVIIF